MMGPARGVFTCLLGWALANSIVPAAQPLAPSKTGGSTNVRLIAHLPTGGYFRAGGIDLEQELERPYVYVARMLDQAGFDIVDIRNPAQPSVIYSWRFDRAVARTGLGGESLKYFKVKGRYYLVKGVAFEPGSPDAELSAIVFDVTGLPDPQAVKEVGRIPGGRVTHIFTYKHSDGRTLLFTTPSLSLFGNVYDLSKFLAGDANHGFIGRIPLPDNPLKNPTRGYHDTHVYFDPVSRQDRLYGAGTGGFYVFDITRPEQPVQLAYLMAADGVIASGHTLTPTPDGRFAIAQVEREHWPVMIFDLQAGEAPAGGVRTIREPVGAWMADWQTAAHTHDTRWPYVFVAGFEDGLQIFNMIDPRAPRTVGWYYTCECAHKTGWGGVDNPRGTSVYNGASDVRVRNADGIIVVSDYNTGLWLFRLDGFPGWNGADWGVPNISSAQNWDSGPDRNGARPTGGLR